LVDAFDDGQTEADTGVAGANALGAALKRLGKGGDQLLRERKRTPWIASGT
jgi:hypothetical protein